MSVSAHSKTLPSLVLSLVLLALGLVAPQMAQANQASYLSGSFPITGRFVRFLEGQRGPDGQFSTGGKVLNKVSTPIVVACMAADLARLAAVELKEKVQSSLCARNQQAGLHGHGQISTTAHQHVVNHARLEGRPSQGEEEAAAVQESTVTHGRGI